MLFQKKFHKKLQVETCAKQCRHQGCQTDFSFENNEHGDKLSESWLMETTFDDDEWQPSDKS